MTLRYYIIPQIIIILSNSAFARYELRSRKISRAQFLGVLYVGKKIERNYFSSDEGNETLRVRNENNGEYSGNLNVRTSRDMAAAMTAPFRVLRTNVAVHNLISQTQFFRMNK